MSDHRIVNPSSPWRDVLDLQTDPLPDEHDAPTTAGWSGVGLVLDLELLGAVGESASWSEVDPVSEDVPRAEQVKLRLTRDQAVLLAADLRQALTEISGGS